MNLKTRIPVLAPDGTPLMPTLYRRAVQWVELGKAKWISNDLNIKAIQLLEQPSGTGTQPIVVGIDPGKLFSGIAAQSQNATLFAAHLLLPFPNVTKKMSGRRILRRARRGRRINRKTAFNLRAHRQKRFNNRRNAKLPPSVRSNRELELRIVQELSRLLPISCIVYEYIETRGNKGFSPVMVGQKIMRSWLNQIAPVTTQFGWETANLRRQLWLQKEKANKAIQSPQTHAVDGITLACSQFIQYRTYYRHNEHGHEWVGTVCLTSFPFRVIARPNLFRRQLHFENPIKGGNRKRKGSTITPFGFRSGDFVHAEKAGQSYRGWIGGFTETEKSKKVSVYDHNWHRIGQFSPNKVQLIRRSARLCIAV